jgi:heptosyltransferase-2
MSPVPDAVWPYPKGGTAIWQAARTVHAGHFSTAYVLPHSLRSALPAVLGRVPERIGTPGPLRRALMTRVVHPRPSGLRSNQTYEYLDLMAPWAADAPPPRPLLHLPGSAREDAKRLLGDGAGPWIGLIPGAARGPAKRWPAPRFAAVGRRLAADGFGRVVVLGTAAEAALCAEVADACGPSAISTAGRTDFPTWAALLSLCRLAIANDSGGMHLAAALGVPVVGIFGATDPSRTAPLSRGRWLQAPGVAGRRDIARDDRRARAALEAISVDEVYGAARDLLAESEDWWSSGRPCS